MESFIVGDHVKDEYSYVSGMIRKIIDRWDSGFDKGVYDPKVAVVELDNEFVNGGNNGFACMTVDRLILIKRHPCYCLECTSKRIMDIAIEWRLSCQT